jgi:hypothetical protein
MYYYFDKSEAFDISWCWKKATSIHHLYLHPHPSRHEAVGFPPMGTANFVSILKVQGFSRCDSYDVTFMFFPREYEGTYSYRFLLMMRILSYRLFRDTRIQHDGKRCIHSSPHTKKITKVKHIENCIELFCQFQKKKERKSQRAILSASYIANENE